MTSAQHSSKSNLWYTPPHIVEAARAVLGRIDLDPCSDDTGQQVVKAARFYSRLGLSQHWTGSVFCNPPGGKLAGNKSSAAAWWQKLMCSEVDQAIWVGFNIEQLAVTQGKGVPCIMDFPICIPRERIHFSGSSSPSHSNVIAYIPNTVDHTAAFMTVFSAIGACKL